MVTFSPSNSMPAFSGVGALQVNIPNDIYEFARGDNITLPCSFETKGTPSLVIITWTVEGIQANAKEVSLLFYWMYVLLWILTIERIIVLHRLLCWNPQCSSDALHSLQNLIATHYSNDGRTDIPPAFEKRFSLDVDVAKRKANLKISSITLGENKVFECRVQIPGDDEGKLADTARLVVLGDTNICFFFSFFLLFYDVSKAVDKQR